MLIRSRKNKVAWNLDVFCFAFSKYFVFECHAVLSDKGLTLETSSFESLYIHIITPADKTKLSYNTPHWCSTTGSQET